MESSKLGFWLQICGNIGILLGLVFVGVQLYQDRQLDIYAALIGIYAVLSVWGFLQWLRAYRQQLPDAPT